MKELYENLECFLSVILQFCSFVGMLCMSCFVRYLFWGSLTVQFFVILSVVSVLLTWGMNELRMEVRYRRLLMEAQKNEQAEKLYEHLRV